MAEIKLAVKIEGLDKLHRKTQAAGLWEQPVFDLLQKAGLVIVQRAQLKAPTDRGRLRASIKSRIDFRSRLFDRSLVARVIVKPHVRYGAFVEFGTRPHWPPLSAMQPWAVRHGFPAGRRGAFLVARAISKHGTKPQPYMIPAAEESKPEIQRFADDAAHEIEARWRTNG